MSQRSVSWWTLVVVTSVNYAAQGPYFIHNDYSAAHPLPGVRAVALLGATLVWFVVGMIGVAKRRRWGHAVLLSYLFTEAMFYAMTIISGTFVGQIENPSVLLRVIFVLGYASGAVAAYYAIRMFRERRRERRGSERAEVGVVVVPPHQHHLADNGRALDRPPVPAVAGVRPVVAEDVELA